MSRQRRQIDMLPLLDVFMVIVFLFATIQEGTARELEATAEEQARAAASATTALLEERETAQAKEKRAVEALRALQDQVATAKASSSAEVEPRTANVLDRLLEKATVVEIEIVGALSDDGEIEHRCCFRSDPRQAVFAPCGTPPTAADAQERWLEGEGAPLAKALRATAGGAALTLIRQDRVAAYRISARLGDTIRKLFPDRQVYAETPRDLVPACAK